MPNHKKIKISIIAAFAFIVGIISPAHANAPQAELMQIYKSIAFAQPQKYAKIKMAHYRWGKTQSNCLMSLWGKESGWNHLADNPKSTAFGIAQMLGETNKSPMVQIDNGLRYIKHRYDTPCNAWRFWQRNKWY